MLDRRAVAGVLPDAVDLGVGPGVVRVVDLVGALHPGLLGGTGGGAALRGGVLRGAVLRGAALRGVALRGVALRGTALCGGSGRLLGVRGGGRGRRGLEPAAVLAGGEPERGDSDHRRGGGIADVAERGAVRHVLPRSASVGKNRLPPPAYALPPYD
ncbi:pentapeptide repeat-containing protein [Streptomyces sp. NPDC007100]|uniref:pentapeptide repeat-containing protein n=1 Tax=Streptomyces sp. NPDC007100 TaxID=3155602 RepID=UPI0034035038